MILSYLGGWVNRKDFILSRNNSENNLKGISSLKWETEWLWQRYEGQVHGTENSSQNNLHKKQCMAVPEEGTAGKHRAKNLSHQLHIIKKPQTIQRFQFFLQTYLHVKLEHLPSSNLRESTCSSIISNLILIKNYPLIGFCTDVYTYICFFEPHSGVSHVLLVICKAQHFLKEKQKEEIAAGSCTELPKPILELNHI